LEHYMTATHPQAGASVATAPEGALGAPSPRNPQPWRFETTSDRIDQLLTRGRVLTVVDGDAGRARHRNHTEEVPS
jgi:hypothetical protein